MSPRVSDLQPHTAQNIAEFMALLRLMKVRSGLNYRQLEARAEAAGEVLPRSTLSAALNRTTLPREELLIAFVRACGNDDTAIKEWVAARRRLEEATIDAPKATVEPPKATIDAPKATVEASNPTASHATVEAPKPETPQRILPAAVPPLLLPSEPVADAKQWAFTWGDDTDSDEKPDTDPEPSARAAPSPPPPPPAIISEPAPPAAATLAPSPPPAATPPPPLAATPAQTPLPAANVAPPTVSQPVAPPPAAQPSDTSGQRRPRRAPASHRLSETGRRGSRKTPPERNSLPALPPQSERGPQRLAVLNWLVPPAIARASFPIRVLLAVLILVLVVAFVGAAAKVVRERAGATYAPTITVDH